MTTNNLYQTSLKLNSPRYLTSILYSIVFIMAMMITENNVLAEDNQCPTVNYSSSDRKITFDTLAMELYNPITDQPTGEFALFTGTDLNLKAHPGFYDFRYKGSELTYTEQVIEASDNCYPTYSTQEETVYFPKVEVPLVSVLPDGSLVNGGKACYKAFLKQANTQELVFTLTDETNEISCDVNSACNTPSNAICPNLSIDTANQDIQVNTTTLYDQDFAKVTALHDGGWIITWSSQNSSSWNIGLPNWDTYMQRYNSCGIAVGTETLVNTTTTADEWLQDAITLSDGSYVILWNHSGSNTNNPGIYMKHYAANSNLQSADTLLKSFPTAYPKYSVAELNDPVTNSCQSDFVMAWDDYDNADIRMQRYTSSGQLIGNEIASGYTNVSYQSGNVPNASIASLQDGGWVLVWFQDSYNIAQLNANPSRGVYMQRYSSAGLLIGTITQINTQTSMNWHKSAVIGLQNGGWLVAIPRDGTPIGIRLLQYNANGIQVSSQLIATNHNFGPGIFPISMIELANNDWVVAWSSFGYPANNYASGAYMQRLDSNGTPVGNEIRANQYLANYDFPPSMAALPDGGWVTTWNSFAQDGDRYGVYMKRYDAQGNVIH